jgi:site-specific recombinase XerD
LDAPFIGKFLDHLEKERGVTARSRTTRLAAMHSFFQFVSFQEPARADQCRRILAILSKRYERRMIEHLKPEEIDAMLAAPDRATWLGRRNRALLLVAIQTGLRVSEPIGLRRDDVVLGTGAHVRCEGKGRNDRCTLLRLDVVAVLSEWLQERPIEPSAPAFPSSRGGPLCRDAVERLVARHQRSAEERRPSLKRKRVTSHVLRHTAAMQLLRHRIDSSVIALWLGHESVETTEMYLHADLRQKEEALAKVTPSDLPPKRFRPDDELLAFLEGL